MIGVLVPAHNEEASLGACLESIRAAAEHPALAGLPVRIAVALDRCTDGSAGIARRLADEVIELEQGDVGAARAAAAAALLDWGATWLASTDADSVVPPHWLAGQPRASHDVFCGIVRVADWSGWAPDVVTAYERTPPVDGHPHIHGANLGLSAGAYRLAGGFKAAHAHEDVALVRRCEALGLAIARWVDPAVVTSARRDPRAREGFGDFLANLERRVAAQREAGEASKAGKGDGAPPNGADPVHMQ